MKNERALITGASAGIGAAFAERLARDQYDLVLVARRRDRLEALAGQLQQKYSIRVEVLAADLTKPDELKKVETSASQNPPITLLINNAGFGGYMPFVQVDPDRAEEQIRLHVLAVTRLTRAALAGMVFRKSGAIINVSSRLAFSGSMPSPPLPKALRMPRARRTSTRSPRYSPTNWKAAAFVSRPSAPASLSRSFTPA